MGKERFSIPRLGWEGELPDGLPEADPNGLRGDEEIATNLPVPEAANYGPIESIRPEDSPSVASNPAQAE